MDACVGSGKVQTQLTTPPQHSKFTVTEMPIRVCKMSLDTHLKVAKKKVAKHEKLGKLHEKKKKKTTKKRMSSFIAAKGQ